MKIINSFKKFYYNYLLHRIHKQMTHIVVSYEDIITAKSQKHMALIETIYGLKLKKLKEEELYIEDRLKDL